MCLTDEQWAVIRPLLPPPSPASRGRPPIDERRVLDAILWKLRTFSPWYDLPPGLPSWQTCYRRFRLWQRRGVLNAVFNALDRDLRDRSGFNFRVAFSAGRIRFIPCKDRIQIVFDPSLRANLQQAWQLETVFLLVAILFMVVRKKYPSHRFPLNTPVLLAQPDCSSPSPT